LVFDATEANRVASAIRNSKILKDGRVAVKWDVPEVQQLHSMGIKAPSPIERRYQWTGKFKPFDHQRKTASFFTKHQRAFCFNEMGTGKTASAIWAADYLLKEGFVTRVLVVCPMSIMDAAWRQDLFSFAMHRHVDVAHGSADKRQKILNSPVEFVITNYDSLRTQPDAYAKAGFDLIIVDEATHYKNATTKRWKALAKIIKDDTWLWLMTGTPAAQSPVDAHGIARLVNPNAVPRSQGAWRDVVMLKTGQFTYEPRPGYQEIVHNVLQPAIRFTKAECLDLPGVTYTTRIVTLTPQQKKYYNEIRKQMRAEASGEVVTAVNAAVKINKLLQISAGAVYTDDQEVLEFDISNRYTELKSTIDEAGHKVLVFVPFRHTIDILHERLVKDGVSTKVIAGDVSAAARAEIFKDFQNTPDPRVLIIQPQAAAHGVTLTAADTIVWWAPTSSLETYAQANARVDRAGQKNKCTVVRLQGSPAEARMYSMLDKRIENHTTLIDMYGDVLDIRA
jgi:SNF2 family DNA or RNA helicase